MSPLQFYWQARQHINQAEQYCDQPNTASTVTSNGQLPTQHVLATCLTKLNLLSSLSIISSQFDSVIAIWPYPKGSHFDRVTLCQIPDLLAVFLIH